MRDLLRLGCLALAIATNAASGCAGGQTGVDEWLAPPPAADAGRPADAIGDTRPTTEAIDARAVSSEPESNVPTNIDPLPDATAAGGMSGMSGTVDDADGSDGFEGSRDLRDETPPTCPDLDGNETPDCRETLVTNPTFLADATDWPPVGGSRSFDARDARGQIDSGGAATSGSLAVTNFDALPSADQPQVSMTAAVQCIPASAGKTYELYAESCNARPDDATNAAATALGASFFPTPGCTGTPIVSYLGPVTATGRDWTRRRATAPAPSGSNALLVRLLVQKSLSQPSATALFDNVLVKSQ